MNFVAALLALLVLSAAGAWYREFSVRTEEHSAFQMLLGAPRLARFSPRRRQIVAHLVIAVPAVMLIAGAVLMGVLVTR